MEKSESCPAPASPIEKKNVLLSPSNDFTEDLTAMSHERRDKGQIKDSGSIDCSENRSSSNRVSYRAARTLASTIAEHSSVDGIRNGYISSDSKTSPAHKQILSVTKREKPRKYNLERKQRQARLDFGIKTGTEALSLKLKSDLNKTEHEDMDYNSQTTKNENETPLHKNTASKQTLETKAHLSSPDRIIPDVLKLFVKIPIKRPTNVGNGNGVIILNVANTLPIDDAKCLGAVTKTKNVTLKTKKPVSRTTIFYEKGKLTRSNPGPLVPLQYNLYDDNLIQSHENKAISNEKLAFGFPVKPSPFAPDITYIITFLSIFREIILIGPLGPSDFEEGLGLGTESNNIPEDNSGKPATVSPNMDLLFRKLLALVLNRKKPIASDGQRSALQEIKSKRLLLGLPQEWRDDSKVYTTKSTPNPTKDQANNPKLDNSEKEIMEIDVPLEFSNPFHEASFEKFGISGIESAEDRCIMLRCLVSWCLSENTIIKQALSDAVNQQDSSGERDTSYGCRAILKGSTHTHEMKKVLEKKFHQKGKVKLSSEPAEFPKYFDPASDPLKHPLFYRLNEFVIGDCGFHIGRFYLVRMADAASGRVSSMDQMRNLTRDSSGVRLSPPSGFALYVEDVHALLSSLLETFGLEFDKDGNEIEGNMSFDESHHWFSVASTCEELERFLVHLSYKLGMSESSENVIPQSSILYKPTLHMYSFLSLLWPMMLQYENLKADSAVISRASRRKRVEYTAQPDLDNDDYAGGADEDYSEEEFDDEYLD